MWLGCLGLFGLGQGSGDVDHGQQGEHVGLDKSGEEIKVAGENSGQAVSQNGNTCQNAGGLEQTEEAEDTAENAGYQGQLFAVSFVLGAVIPNRPSKKLLWSCVKEGLE